MQDLLAYQAGNSLVHRMNPVTKLAVTSCLVLAAFVSPTLIGPVALTAVVVLAVVVAGVTRPVARVGTILLGPFAVALFLIHGLVFPDRETPLITIGVLTIWEEGVAYAALVLFRVATLVLGFLVAVITTAPKRMMVAFVDKGMSPKLAYVFLSALQFVPEMQERARVVLDAQQARGLDVKANLRRRAAAFVALMGPLIGGALIATETRAMALEARAFSRPGARTYLVEVDDPAWERALRWLVAGALVVLIAWRVAWA